MNCRRLELQELQSLNTELDSLAVLQLFLSLQQVASNVVPLHEPKICKPPKNSSTIPGVTAGSCEVGQAAPVRPPTREPEIETGVLVPG